LISAPGISHACALRLAEHVQGALLIHLVRRHPDTVERLDVKSGA